MRSFGINSVPQHKLRVHEANLQIDRSLADRETSSGEKGIEVVRIINQKEDEYLELVRNIVF